MIKENMFYGDPTIKDYREMDIPSIISTMQLIHFFILLAIGLTLNFCVPNHLEAVSTFGLFLLPSLSREGQGVGLFILPAPRQSYRRPGCRHLGCRHPR